MSRALKQSLLVLLTLGLVCLGLVSYQLVSHLMVHWRSQPMLRRLDLVDGIISDLRTKDYLEVAERTVRDAQ